MNLQPELGLIKESIEHWVRMLEWGRKQNPSRTVSIFQMEAEIGENWYASSCPLCRRFRRLDAPCKKCPLGDVFGRCDDFLSMNAWSDVSKARYWGEWVESAEVMVEQLKTVFKLLRVRT